MKGSYIFLAFIWKKYRNQYVLSPYDVFASPHNQESSAMHHPEMYSRNFSILIVVAILCYLLDL